MVTRSEGRATRLLALGEDRILLQYTVSGEEKDTELVCFDLQGRKLWSHLRFRVLHSLPGNMFLVNTPEGGLASSTAKVNSAVVGRVMVLKE